MRGAPAPLQSPPDRPYVSVIMPVLDRAWLVESALESLRRQTWRDFEVIVVDDASTDDTPAILAKWAASEPWLRVITLPVRVGPPAARNRALATALGEVIAYLDSDNLFYANALETIAETFKSSPDTWSIYTAHVWQFADGELRVRCPHATLLNLLARRETFDINAFAHRRGLYQSQGGFDENLTRLSDWEMAMRYAKTAMPRRVAMPTGRYRHGDWQRVTNQQPVTPNLNLIAAKHALCFSTALRVLVIAGQAPAPRDAGIAGWLNAGVDLFFWPEQVTGGGASTGFAGLSLAEAIGRVQPDLVHLDGPDLLTHHARALSALKVKLTMRAPGLQISPDLLAQWRAQPALQSVYIDEEQAIGRRDRGKPLVVIPSAPDGPRPGRNAEADWPTAARMILEDWRVLTGTHLLAPRESCTLARFAATDKLRFGKGEAGETALREGFHNAEAWGVWTGQPRATLAFVASGDAWASIRTIAIDAHALTAGQAELAVAVSINGQPIGTCGIGGKHAQYRMDLGAVTLEPGMIVHLALDSERPVSPRDAGRPDKRRLGVALKQIAFLPTA